MPGERIHVVGIAGSGAAGTAVLLQQAGARVDGCDLDAPSPYTPPLDAAGIRYVAGHDPAHLDGVERVAISPALRAVPDLVIVHGGSRRISSDEWGTSAPSTVKVWCAGFGVDRVR